MFAFLGLLDFRFTGLGLVAFSGMVVCDLLACAGTCGFWLVGLTQCRFWDFGFWDACTVCFGALLVCCDTCRGLPGFAP